MNKYKPVLEAFALAIIFFICHVAVAYFLDISRGLEILAVLYGTLFLASAVILLILIQIMKRNIDNVGYAFMLLTCIKMIVIYFMFKGLVTDDSAVLSKAHLIGAFFIFLGIETYSTSKMLNKK